MTEPSERPELFLHTTAHGESMATQEQEVRTFSLPSAGYVVAWCFGVFTLTLGAYWWSRGYLVGPWYFTVGAFTMPNVRRGIRERWNVGFSRGMTVLLILVGWGVALALPP